MVTATTVLATAALVGQPTTALRRFAPTDAQDMDLASITLVSALVLGHLMIVPPSDAKTIALEMVTAETVPACVDGVSLVLIVQLLRAPMSVLAMVFARTEVAIARTHGLTLIAPLNCVEMVAHFPTESATMARASAAHSGMVLTAKSQFV